MTASSVSSQPTSSVDDPPVPMAAPDWEATTNEICCPLCEYNLRGLSDARCPECGSQYTWAELLDPRRREHPYLFEHHPERNWWSFWRTVMGGLNPQAFWTTLHPMQRISRTRLFLYGVILISMGVALFLFGQCWAVVEQNYWLFGISVVTELSMLIQGISARIHAPSIWNEFFVVVAWLVISGVSLMMMRGSIRNAGANYLHVLRVSIYASDLILWFLLAQACMTVSLHIAHIALVSVGLEMGQFAAILICLVIWTKYARPNLASKRMFRAVRTAGIVVFLFLVAALVEQQFTVYRIPPQSGMTTGFQWLSKRLTHPVIYLIGWAYFTNRLTVGLREYARMRRPVLAVVVTQIITGLIVANMIVIRGAW